MSPLLLSILLSASAAPPDSAAGQFERDGVRVQVSVTSQDYTWTVTNVDAPPIMSFEIGKHACYDYHAPEGWTIETDDHHFRASTDDRLFAIRPRQSRPFSARVSSRGAVLGNTPLTIGVGDGDAVRFESVWGVVPYPRYIVYLIGLTIMMIGGLHALLLARREKPGVDSQQ